MDSPQQTTLNRGDAPVIKPRPIEEYQEPPDDTFPPEQPPILVPATVVSSVLET
jgi:hypothetical protein